MNSSPEASGSPRRTVVVVALALGLLVSPVSDVVTRLAGSHATGLAHHGMSCTCPHHRSDASHYAGDTGAGTLEKTSAWKNETRNLGAIGDSNQCRICGCQSHGTQIHSSKQLNAHWRESDEAPGSDRRRILVSVPEKPPVDKRSVPLLKPPATSA